MKKIYLGLIGLLALVPVLSILRAQEVVKVPPGTPVTITVTPAKPAEPTVTINLGNRHGHVTPLRKGCTHTAAGNIDVAQAAADTLQVTMTGVAVATPCLSGSTATMTFDLHQCFEVVFEKPEVKKAKMTIEGRLIGLLRSKNGGTAEVAGACATITSDPVEIVTLCVPPHSVCAGQDLSLNCHEGPVSVPLGAGKYTLHQTLQVSATHRGLCGKAASAEFAPDALDPLWISYREPFRGASKKDFGFQILIKVAAEENGNGAPPPKQFLPEPKK